MDLQRGMMPTPGDMETLLASKSEIYTLSGIDSQAVIADKLGLEWDSVPLDNDRLSEDIEGQADITHRLTLVYISGFFTDSCDFVYSIEGGSNMSRFMLGTFSGTPYDKPCFATPLVIFNSEELFDSSGLDMFNLDTVSKTESKGIRWKYLYESGVKAWEKLSFNQKKFEMIRKRNDEIDERVMLSSSSKSSPDVQVAASQEGEKIPETDEMTPESRDAKSHSDDSEGDVDTDDQAEDSDVAIETRADNNGKDGKVYERADDADDAERAEESDVAIDTPDEDEDEDEDGDMI